MMATVAIVIPCFNVSEYVERAVSSVLKQGYRHISEIVLVDNNSTDDTWPKIQMLSRLSEKIKVLQEMKPGACAARNKGWKACSGEYIHFLDADDELMDGAVERKMELLVKEKTDFLISGHIRISEDGKATDNIPLKDCFKGVFVNCIGGASSNIIRREMLESVGGWNEELSSSQESTLYFELMKAGAKVSYYMTSMSYVYDRPGQISKSDPGKRWSHYLRLRVEIIRYLKEKHIDYFMANRTFFLQSLFDIIHIVYPYCPELAAESYRTFIHGQFRPSSSPAVSSSFIRLSGLLGFERAERLKLKMKGGR